MKEIKQWNSWFFLLCRRYWRMPGIWFLAGFCLLILLLFQSLVFSGSDNRRFGVLDGGTRYASEILDTLDSDDSPYDLVMMSSYAELERKVASGYLDCGFVLTKKLDEVHALKDLEGTVDYIVSTSSQKGLFIRERVLAAVLQTAARQTLLSYATDGETFVDPPKDLDKELLASFEEWLDSDSLIQITFQTVDTDGSTETGLDLGHVSAADRLRALCAILLFSASLVFARTRFSRETRALHKVLRGTDGHVWNLLSIYAPTLLLSLILAFGNLLLLRVSDPREATPGRILGTLLLLLLCGIVSTIWSFIYSALFRNDARYLTSLIGVLLLCVISNPVLLPASNLVPTLRILRVIFPSTLGCIWF